MRGTTAAVAPQDCNGRAAAHGALAADRPAHAAVPRELGFQPIHVTCRAARSQQPLQPAHRPGSQAGQRAGTGLGCGRARNYSLRCTRTVGTVPAPDAPRRWADCTIPSYRRCPADEEPPTSRRYLASTPETPRSGDQRVSVSHLGAPRKKMGRTAHPISAERESAALRNSAPQFFDPRPPLPLGPQRCPLSTRARSARHNCRRRAPRLRRSRRRPRRACARPPPGARHCAP